MTIFSPPTAAPTVSVRYISTSHSVFVHEVSQGAQGMLGTLESHAAQQSGDNQREKVLPPPGVYAEVVKASAQSVKLA